MSLREEFVMLTLAGCFNIHKLVRNLRDFEISLWQRDRLLNYSTNVLTHPNHRATVIV